jgi:putative oxidoreductase
MRFIPIIAGILLGLLFTMASATYLLGMMPPQPAPPAGSFAALFMGALAPSGYLTFVKVLELIGAVLVAIPLTRNLGLLILGPIIVNILAFHIFIQPGGLLHPMIIAIIVLPLVLLVSERRAFAALVRRPA